MPDPTLYTVGLITAITTEYAAACAMLDSEEEEGPDSVSANDINSYTLGTMGKHNVVIACLPHGDYGTSSAAAVASNMMTSFPNIRIGLMVGIGGGAPTTEHDVRLGDIVVSARDGDSSTGSVFQYDFGKAIQNQEFKPTRLLNQPPPVLLTALSNLRQFHSRKGGHTLENDVQGAFAGSPGIQGTHSRPDSATDRLYKSEYVHNTSCCADSGGDDDSNLVVRAPRTEGEGMSAIHYGVVASANQLMKDAKMRDKIAKDHGVLCFEMEAAGLMNHFPCLVVRGICDYSDSHKNKQWQGYAAMMAAAYTKCLLKRIAPTRIEQEKKLSEIVTSVEESVKSMHAATADMQGSVNDARLEHQEERIHKWISHPDLDPSVNYNKAREERIKDSNSGQWFLENETFTAWKLRKNSSLWLYGITGCGKTVLISTVLEHLKRTYENVLYFYFDFAQKEKQSVDGMVRCLISQLTGKSKASRKHIDSLYASHQQGNMQPNLRSLCETLQAMIKESGEMWIILDALDECTMREDPNGYPGCGLLSWIKSLVSYEMANVHLIFTSRPEQDIKSALDKWMDKENIFPIERGLMNEDIQEYVHKKVREHRGLERWNDRPHVQEEIESALLKRANGMFRWVACQLEQLKDCVDLYTLRDALKTLPTTLEGTYARILNNIPATTRHLTIRILQFLVYGQRPLAIEEAVDIVVVRTDPEKKDSWFRKDYRLPIPEEIARYCSSLVSVTERRIQLAHFSVKEYLVSNQLEPKLCNEFQDIVARTCITEVCLAYLLALLAQDVFDDDREGFPFAELAAWSWIAHATVVEQQSESVLFFVREFISRVNFDRFCTLWRNFDPDKALFLKSLGIDDQKLLFLHFAVLVGLPCSVQMLLDQIPDAHNKNRAFSELLHIAIQEGHEKVARKLVASGANVNEHDRLPLCEAAKGRYDGIVRCLLDNGADLAIQGGMALRHAVDAGSESIVRLLISAGAGTHKTSERNAFNLGLALAKSNKRIFQVFIETGLLRNAHDSVKFGALYAASQAGRKDISVALLENGAPTGLSGDHNHLTPLYTASQNGHSEIVELLLDHGACIDTHSILGGPALEGACGSGKEDIVKTLLRRGADVNANSGISLYSAARQGHESIVRILLSHSARINLMHDTAHTPLAGASKGGHTKIVDMLLSNGADPSIASQGGQTAFSASCAGGYVDICRKLLAKSASIKGVETRALYYASKRGHIEVVRLLLDLGCDVESEYESHGRPLTVACAEGHETVVSTLLQHGAKVYNNFDIPIQAALRRGDKEMVRRLRAVYTENKHGKLREEAESTRGKKCSPSEED